MPGSVCLRAHHNEAFFGFPPGGKKAYAASGQELWNMQQGIFRKRKAEPAPQAVAAVVEEDDDGESITY